MKEQDAKHGAGRRFIVYVEKEDSTYGPVETRSLMVENYFDDYLQKRKRLEESCLERVRKGEISPIACYMQLADLSEADLACRVRVSRRQLRKHLTPQGFAAIGLPLAARYAEVFGVPVANLFQVLAAGEGCRLTQEKTASPLVVVTRAGKGEGRGEGER